MNLPFPCRCPVCRIVNENGRGRGRRYFGASFVCLFWRENHYAVGTREASNEAPHSTAKEPRQLQLRQFRARCFSVLLAMFACRLVSPLGECNLIRVQFSCNATSRNCRGCVAGLHIFGPLLYRLGVAHFDKLSWYCGKRRQWFSSQFMNASRLARWVCDLV